MIDVRVDAPDKLGLVARTLRDIGAKDLARELYRGLNLASMKLKADAKAEASRRLPHRGGLASRVAGAKLSTRRRSGLNPGVSIQAKGMDQLAGMDAGVVKHPVYGQRDVWVTQRVTPGWFTEPMEAGKDEAAAAIGAVLDVVAVKVAARLDSV